MEWYIASALLVSGILLLIIEVYLIPGTYFFAFLGSVMLFGGVAYSYMYIGALEGTILLIGSLIGISLFIGLLTKTGTINKFVLGDENSVGKDDKDIAFLLGKKGKALTPLRPSGTVLIDNEKYDAVSDGAFIFGDEEIIVSKIRGNTIVVSKNEEEQK